jgi:GNAT superfamily N-acetyltransferase
MTILLSFFFSPDSPTGAGRLRSLEAALGRLQRVLRREGPTALPDEITQVTWQRFFDAYEPVHALVAERDGQLVGLTHYLFHRSTTRIEPTCYLQDLFTLPSERGRGVGRQLDRRGVRAREARGRTPRVLADACHQHRRTHAVRQGRVARRIHRVRHAGLTDRPASAAAEYQYLMVTPAFTPLLLLPSLNTPPVSDTLPPVLAPSE